MLLVLIIIQIGMRDTPYLNVYVKILIHVLLYMSNQLSVVKVCGHCKDKDSIITWFSDTAERSTSKHTSLGMSWWWNRVRPVATSTRLLNHKVFIAT